MSAMSAQKRVVRIGGNSEKRAARAYKRIAAKAYFAGDEGRADRMLGLSDYWAARAMCNRDKDVAVDGAAMRVEIY